MLAGKNSFIGWYGHSFFSDGDMDTQFQIVAHDGTLYAVRIKGWNSGMWCGPDLMNAEQLLKCDVYRTEKEWIEAGERAQAAAIRKELRETDRRQREHREQKRKALLDMFG